MFSWSKIQVVRSMPVHFFSFFNFNDHGIQHLISQIFIFFYQLIRILIIYKLFGLNFLRLGNQIIMLFSKFVEIQLIVRNFLPFLAVLEIVSPTASVIIFSMHIPVRRSALLLFPMGNKVKILEIFLIFSLKIFMISMLIMKIH